MFGRVVAWAMLVSVLLVSVVPIEFRPVLTSHPGYECFLTFFVLAIAFSIAYPRHQPVITGVLLVTAGLFEILKLTAEGRHATFYDAEIKAAGVMAGSLLGYTVRKMRRAGTPNGM
jgi:hypothetical protein